MEHGNVDGLSRAEFLQVGAAGTAATTIGQTSQQSSAPGPLPARAGGGSVAMRWYGGGVYELSTPDSKHIVLVDAWIWNNAGWDRFGLKKPPELASAAGYAAHLQSRKPDAVVVALTHDHLDHMGDYFELLQTLVGAGIDVKTLGQSDLMRVGLVPKFKAANLDMATLILNSGAGVNMGGTAVYKGLRFELVPAVHSTSLAYPSAGFIIDIGGVRVYASGDTDLFGDIALIGARYHPDVAVVSAGNGPFTMGPADAALACRLSGAGQVVPVHYAHNGLVLGTDCGNTFRTAAAKIIPNVKVTVLQPGQSTTFTTSA